MHKGVSRPPSCDCELANRVSLCWRRSAGHVARRCSLWRRRLCRPLMHRQRAPQRSGGPCARTICTHHMHAGAYGACRQLFRSSQLCPVLSRSVHNLSRTRTARRAPIAHRSPRRGHQLSKLSDDLSMLCGDPKVLPTNHLPWAGFGLRQPHCPTVNVRFYYYAHTGT